jgi:hypothetical protein
MSNLADVRDLDSVKSFSPLVLGMSAREVSGAAAVLRRILYRWCSRKGSLRHAPSVGLDAPLTDLDAATWSTDERDGYGEALVREAKDEDFVDDATVTLRLDDAGTLTVRGSIRLIDGKTYALEVDAGAAGAALKTIGGAL